MRSRFIYIVISIVVIVFGISSRMYSEHLPLFIAKYSGDTLWGLMVFLMIEFVFRSRSTFWVWCAAMIFSYFIEFSQLHQAVWINTIRHTVLGGLILGYGFLWTDLVCYTVGITTGVMIERKIFAIHE